MDGYSDWEYYSDDYYDDDASLLKNNPQEGSPLQRSTSKRPNGVHRGKKRKLAATSNIPEISLDEHSRDAVRATGPLFEGTVWRAPSPEKKEKKLYEPGIGERVALLGNWREVFRASQPFSKKPTKGSSNTRRSNQKTTQTTDRSPSIETSLSQNVNLSGSSEALELEEDELAASRHRKSRRLSIAKGSQSPPTHSVVVEIPVQRHNRVAKEGQAKQREIALKPPSSKKRKANEAENENTTEEMVQLRAKRSTWGKVPPKAKEKAKPRPLPVGRTTRSKKT